MKYFILFIAILATTLDGSIVHHVKPAGEKTGDHSMRNIDFIYILNLDARPEKFALCTAQLHPYGVFPFRFSAVNGWELTLEDINDLGVRFAPSMEGGYMGTSYLPDGDGTPFHEDINVIGRTYFHYGVARGTIGIVLSHFSILQDAYDSGYETIWVMEDDIHVIKDPHMISDLIDRLDRLVGDWDILFTDRDTKDKEGNYVPCFSYARRPNFVPENPERFAERRKVSRDFIKVGARYGAYSMIVRRSGVKKLLDFIKEYDVFLPYDMDFYLPNDIKIYSMHDDVVSTLTNALSDNGAPNYNNQE